MKSKKVPFISKSKFLLGLQCPKFLWYNYNAKDEIPEHSAFTKALLSQGHLVGDYSKKLYPSGLDVDWDISFDEVIAKSKALLSERKPLFEPGFEYNNAYSRIDILDPVDKNHWDIIEVKSSTKLDAVYVYDVAFQKYCCEGSGLKIRKCFLMQINNQYVKQGDIEPDKLFVTHDISDLVNERIKTVEEELKLMFEVISLEKCPEVKIGPHCSEPYGCLLESICRDFLPKNNVFTFYRMGKKGFELLEQGITSIEEASGKIKLNEKQEIQAEAVISGKPYVNKDEIKRFLSELNYPLHFFDFETLNTAIPLYDGVKPYQQVPFQFSLHVVEKKGAKPKHYEFLADSKEDPRFDLLKEMKKRIGEQGDILAYYMSFEKGRLIELGEMYPEYYEWLNSLIPRFVDLYKPFANFHYYHPEQKGSASIKAVLPVMTGRSYDDMEIGDGTTANTEFLRITYTDVSKAEKEKVRKALLEYCCLDTEGMIDIINVLEKI
ncbi:MAG: DUF2779 domain-containing protein [Nanoarchaeota archaeon]|nr:DUF2779 domain-containing protein [Nanoarchaeota archaeon]MBU1321141.1 DUF2779 domain-containing protein [Nanoarchaeota archaeon]MBU1597895.1 DUF2779 domain-containing protein [Nanoarchaeota archaeon]MBU2441610.1 DUF2779 domain-containing protein [Nanoarchaeota archaeon]